MWTCLLRTRCHCRWIARYQTHLATEQRLIRQNVRIFFLRHGDHGDRQKETLSLLCFPATTSSFSTVSGGESVESWRKCVGLPRRAWSKKICTRRYHGDLRVQIFLDPTRARQARAHAFSPRRHAYPPLTVEQAGSFDANGSAKPEPQQQRRQ